MFWKIKMQNCIVLLLLFLSQLTIASDGDDCGKHDLCDSGFCCDWGTCKSVDSAGGDSKGACANQKKTANICLGVFLGSLCLLAALIYCYYILYLGFVCPNIFYGTDSEESEVSSTSV
jgi:hypothetical protein